MILNTLEYDGQIEKIDSPDGEDRFRQALLAIPETSAFTSIPCGVCPVSFYAKPSTLGILFSDKSAVTESVAVAELKLMHQTSTLLVSRLCLTTPFLSGKRQICGWIEALPSAFAISWIESVLCACSRFSMNARLMVLYHQQLVSISSSGLSFD